MKRFLLLAGSAALALIAMLYAISASLSERTTGPGSGSLENLDRPDAPARPVAGRDTAVLDRGKARIRVLVNRSDGYPARAAAVSLHACAEELGELLPAEREEVADADGACELEDVAPGDWVVMARLDGWSAVTAAVSGLAPDEHREVSLRLTPGRRIRGRILAEDGTPVAGARVTAGPAALHRAVVKGDPRLVGFAFPARHSTETARHGEFTLNHLGAGPYDVGATAWGFLPGAARGVLPTADGVTVVLDPAYGVDVRLTWEGEEPPEATEVLTRDGTPAKLLRRNERSMLYHFRGLAEGEHRIEARAPGFESDAATITVGPEEPGELELRLGSGTLVSGLVTERFTGQPVAGAGVIFLEPPESRGGREIERLRIVTDETGRYETPLGPGFWILRPSKEGYREDPPGGRQSPGTSASDPLRVGSEPVVANLSLIGEYAAVGRVLWRDGRPACDRAYVLVVDRSLLPGAPTVPHPRIPHCRVEKDGTWRIPGLLPVYEYTIEARAGEGNVDRRQGIRFAESASRVEVPDFVLDEPPPLEHREPPPPGTLKGRVVDEAGHPIPGARVSAFAASVATDGAGRFEISGMGWYHGWGTRLRVLALGHPPTHFGRVAGDSGRPWDLGDLVLPARGVRVFGRVTDRQGNPIAGTEVSIRFDGSPVPIVLRPDERGDFEASGPADAKHRPIEVQAEARAPGYGSKSMFARETDFAKFEILLYPLSSVVGKLVFPAGTPPWVDLVMRPGRPKRYELRFEQDGSFELELPPWTLFSRIEAPGYLSADLDRRGTSPGRRTDLGEIRFSRGGTITVRILDHADRPVPGETVKLRWQRPRGRRGPQPRIPDARSDRDGLAHFELLRPGKYFVTVRPTWRPAAVTIELKREQKVTVDIRLP